LQTLWKIRKEVQINHANQARRKPGEMMEADWAGDKLSIKDRNTGEKYLSMYL
jgi:hypothetical protein